MPMKYKVTLRGPSYGTDYSDNKRDAIKIAREWLRAYPGASSVSVETYKDGDAPGEPSLSVAEYMRDGSTGRIYKTFKF